MLPSQKLPGGKGIGSLGKREQRRRGPAGVREAFKAAVAGAAEMLPLRGGAGFLPACSAL